MSASTTQKYRTELTEFVALTAEKFDIPGVTVGVWADGREVFASHGVTSLDPPLPVDEDTLFLLGSVTKTFTATALMRLVADGRVELDAPVRVVDKDPEPLPHDAARAQEVVGVYENDAMTLAVATDGAELTLAAGIKPEIRAAADYEMPADYEPAAMGLLPGGGDEFIVTAGGLAGQRGFFSRDASGAIAGIDLGGRVFGRVPTASA